MVATRGRTFKRPWRRSCHSSKLKSSSAPIGRKDSWRFHAVGSSNAPLLGSTAAEGLQRIGRTSTATRWRSCGLPQSASCSENFVIPPDVFGQTLSLGASVSANLAVDQTMEAAVRSGVAFVVAAGNSGSDVQYPASSRFAMAVAALGAQGMFPENTYDESTIDPTLPMVEALFSPNF